ncbi:uncharacterized protein F4822DRAFT_421102 [Hypoxylon trugodes]|uniref:uncharacterized protein n=1 Tax=Hypoxylon trugodes TaxID=326681 RepID=UPI00219ED17C|nr:uncharacterized protein F4822DRAFT_421102 [Hypoxylon trugodes]KAI1383598.1 hypothetical protein F4822DRAFT_421102 [Hypoxylon trugodes]
MLSQTVVALFLASTAAATYSPQALKGLRDLRQEHVIVEVRQVESDSSSNSADATITDVAAATSCWASLEGLLTDAPTPASDLNSYFDEFMSTADTNNPSILCQATTSLPQSLSAEYSSFDQQASSWFSKHTSDLQAIASKCAGGNSDAVISSLQAYAGQGCGGSTSSGLGAHPTGMVIGAVAAAGVWGVAAAL